MELFWLTDPQWGRIEPLLPKVHTGPVRVDGSRGSYNALPEVRDAVCQNSGDNYNASSFPVSLDVFVQRHLTSCFVVSGEPTA